MDLYVCASMLICADTVYFTAHNVLTDVDVCGIFWLIPAFIAVSSRCVMDGWTRGSERVNVAQ